MLPAGDGQVEVQAGAVSAHALDEAEHGVFAVPAADVGRVRVRMPRAEELDGHEAADVDVEVDVPLLGAGPLRLPRAIRDGSKITRIPIRLHRTRGDGSPVMRASPYAGMAAPRTAIPATVAATRGFSREAGPCRSRPACFRERNRSLETVFSAGAAGPCRSTQEETPCALP